jgi:hypothetical protein
MVPNEAYGQLRPDLLGFGTHSSVRPGGSNVVPWMVIKAYDLILRGSEAVSNLLEINYVL